MTDIVERLRAFATTVTARSRVPLAAAAIINAADEIERLREMVKYFACHCGGECDRSDENCLIKQAALGEKE